MNPFEMVALIVIAVFVAGVLKARVRSSASGSATDVSSAEQARRIDQLEQRVKALEAVVSDQRYELQQQFRDLEKAS